MSRVPWIKSNRHVRGPRENLAHLSGALPVYAAYFANTFRLSANVRQSPQIHSFLPLCAKRLRVPTGIFLPQTVHGGYLQTMQRKLCFWIMSFGCSFVANGVIGCLHVFFRRHATFRHVRQVVQAGDVHCGCEQSMHRWRECLPRSRSPIFWNVYLGWSPQMQQGMISHA